MWLVQGLNELTSGKHSEQGAANNHLMLVKSMIMMIKSQMSPWAGIQFLFQTVKYIKVSSSVLIK